MISAAFGLVSQMKMVAPFVSTMLLPADHPCITDVGKRYIEVAGNRKEEIESHDWEERFCDLLREHRVSWSECHLPEELSSSPWLAALPKRERISMGFHIRNPAQP